jgi:hypothetical protein
MTPCARVASGFRHSSIRLPQVADKLTFRIRDHQTDVTSDSQTTLFPDT